MAVYAVSFEFKWDEGPNGYFVRYDSFMDEIKRRRRLWLETTSFAIVETDETLEAFEQALWLTRFDGTKDKLLVIDVSYCSATVRGAVGNHSTLRTLLPGVVQK